MKKKLVILVISIFLCSASLFSQASHFMLQLDTKLLVNGFEAVKSGAPLVSFEPLIEFDYQIPTQTSVKSYLGLELFPMLPVAVYAIINNKTGYAFQKPEKWKNHHIELLGNLGLGGQLSFAYGLFFIPACELGCQVYWMPEDKGFFWGFGPEADIFFDWYNGLDIDCIFAFSINIGYKF